MKTKQTLLIGVISIVVVLLLFGSRMTVTIDAGHKGIIFRTFAGGLDMEKTYEDGFHIIAPWNRMIVYSLLQQERAEELRVLSSNGLEITVDVSVWFLPQEDKLAELHKRIGVNYANNVLIPAMRSATRSVIGRYTPEDIYSIKRNIIQEEIYQETKAILDEKYIQLNTVLIRAIVLPESIKTAIESKLKQEQLALEYEFKLQRAQKEAEKQKIEAEGKAVANKIISSSLTDRILKEKGIEATLQLANSPNAKIVVVGSGKDGLPLILGNN